MNNFLALMAFAVFVGFLGILIWNVPRLDLMGVVGVTVALAGWDLIKNLKDNRKATKEVWMMHQFEFLCRYVATSKLKISRPVAAREMHC